MACVVGKPNRRGLMNTLADITARPSIQQQFDDFLSAVPCRLMKRYPPPRPIVSIRIGPEMR